VLGIDFYLDIIRVLSAKYLNTGDYPPVGGSTVPMGKKGFSASLLILPLRIVKKKKVRLTSAKGLVLGWY
jgi:hypothetical protein